MVSTRMVALVVAVYVALGFLVLAILDGRDKQIRKQIASTTDQMQIILIWTGMLVSLRVATVIVILSLLLFWPAVVYGRLERRYRARRLDDKS